MNNQIPFFNPYNNFQQQFYNNYYERLEEKIERLEKKIHLLENQLNKIENNIYHPNKDYEKSEPTDMYMI